MKDLNNLTILGRTTNLPELKYTNSGLCVMRFSLANNYSRKVDDKYQDFANFFEVEYWGKNSESVSRYIGKGTMLLIRGELRQDRWEQDGQPRSKVKIIAEELRVIDFHKDKEDPPRTEAEAIKRASQEVPADDFDDDIPF